jgi:stearoyl-CoA desaturase (delta-9 desaturase)
MPKTKLGGLAPARVASMVDDMPDDEVAAIRAKMHDEWKAENMVVPAIAIVIMQLLGLYGLLVACLGREPITGQLVSRFSYQWAFATYWACGVSITGGYHRLFSHRSYRPHVTLKVALLVFGAAALQGSALRWAYAHRIHHKHADHDADPHDRRRGFWHSHMGWIFSKSPHFFAAAAKEDLSDLLSDPIVMWQHRRWLPLGLAVCYGLPALFGALRGGEALTAFLVGGAARHVVVWHCTMLVNSAAHAPSGSKPYGARGLAVQSGLVSLLAWGEGWHDWHHLFPYDSAAAEKHWLVQFNPTYAFLDLCALFGLVSGRKRALNAWHRKKGEDAKDGRRRAVSPSSVVASARS